MPCPLILLFISALLARASPSVGPVRLTPGVSITFIMPRLTSKTSIDQVAELLKVMAHPIRLTIIDLLGRHGESNVKVIQGQVAISQSLVSHHLIKMRDKGILTSVRRRREIYYSLADPELAEWLGLLLKG